MSPDSGPNYSPEPHSVSSRVRGLQTTDQLKFFSLNTDVTKPDASILCAPASGATANAAGYNGQLRLNATSVAMVGKFYLPNVPGGYNGTGAYAFAGYELFWDDTNNRLVVVNVANNTKKSITLT